MTENEVIIVDGITEAAYSELIDECVKYALISLPFTIDRMTIPDETKRALNIAKGKIAEALFTYFCNDYDINIDFGSCSTPFYQVDKKDFIFNNLVWDIKNNFYYSAAPLINNFTNLPALIPNRYNGDQWSKRNETLGAAVNGTAFVFSFLRMTTLLNNTRGRDFLEIVLSEDQKLFIRNAYERYHGLPQPVQPFYEEWFWAEMNSRGPMNFFNLNARPSLIITSYATSQHWNLFRDTGKFDRNNNFMRYIEPQWYVKTNTGSCNFLNGTLWTTITNATSPVSELPAFSSLIHNWTGTCARMND